MFPRPPLAGFRVHPAELQSAIAALNDGDCVWTGGDMGKKPKYRTWLAPKPSRAQRTIPRKSNNHFVGALTFGEELGQGQVLGFESMLEHNIGLVSIYTPGVIDVREQVRVVYTKANGKTSDHFIDFVTVEKKGRRTALIVKPHYRAVRAKFRDTVARVAAAAIPSVVDRVVVVTERVLDPMKLARVEQFHASRFAQPEFDTMARNALSCFEGILSIREFLAMAGLGTEGFHAVVRMVRFGLLEAIEPGLLKLSSPIQPLRAVR